MLSNLTDDSKTLVMSTTTINENIAEEFIRSKMQEALHPVIFTYNAC